MKNGFFLLLFSTFVLLMSCENEQSTNALAEDFLANELFVSLQNLDAADLRELYITEMDLAEMMDITSRAQLLNIPENEREKAAKAMKTVQESKHKQAWEIMSQFLEKGLSRDYFRYWHEATLDSVFVVNNNMELQAAVNPKNIDSQIGFIDFTIKNKKERLRINVIRNSKGLWKLASKPHYESLDF